MLGFLLIKTIYRLKYSTNSKKNMHTSKYIRAQWKTIAGEIPPAGMSFSTLTLVSCKLYNFTILTHGKVHLKPIITKTQTL